MQYNGRNKHVAHAKKFTQEDVNIIKQLKHDAPTCFGHYFEIGMKRVTQCIDAGDKVKLLVPKRYDFIERKIQRL